MNPTTVVYFAAVVIGNPDLADGWDEGSVFVVAAFVASASWQLALAGLGSVLGRSVTSRRGRVVTGWVSGLVIAGLAVGRWSAEYPAGRVTGPAHLRRLLSADLGTTGAGTIRGAGMGFMDKAKEAAEDLKASFATTEVRDSEQAYRDLGMIAYLTTTGRPTTRPTVSG